MRAAYRKQGKPSFFTQFCSPLAVRLLRALQITPRVWERPQTLLLCPQFCLRLMAHSDGESDPLPWIRRNKASEEWLWGSRCAATRLDHGWVNCFRLIQRIQQPRRGKKEDERKKTTGGREGGREAQWSESLPHHFSQQTKTFAWISIWSCEAVFPSCPVIHHLFLPATTPPPTRPHLRPKVEAGRALLRDGLLALCCRPRLRPYWHLRQHPISHRQAVIHHAWRSIAGLAFIRQRCWWSSGVGGWTKEWSGWAPRTEDRDVWICRCIYRCVFARQSKHFNKCFILKCFEVIYMHTPKWCAYLKHHLMGVSKFLSASSYSK